MCILMSVYIVTQRRKAKDGVGWLRLSGDVTEDNSTAKTSNRVGSCTDSLFSSIFCLGYNEIFSLIVLVFRRVLMLLLICIEDM